MANKRRLRIASYNINGINSRLNTLTRWLEAFQPDVVGLQELKCTDEAFPADAIEALGYSAIWHGQRSWNGVALLSRVGDPVETRRARPGTHARTDSGRGPEGVFRQGLCRRPRGRHRAAGRHQQADALSLLRRQGGIVSRGLAPENGGPGRLGRVVTRRSGGESTVLV